MNEHSFIRAINRGLPKEIYHWKINDLYSGGVADSYYSGIGGDLWIEYKFVRLPKRGSSKVVLGLSKQQTIWLTSRYNEGRNVAVVIGSDEGCCILRTPELWSVESMELTEFKGFSVDKKNVREFIISGTTTECLAGVRSA